MSDDTSISCIAILKVPVVISAGNIIVLVAGPVGLLMMSQYIRVTQASQVNLLDLLNTYVTRVSFSVSHGSSMLTTLRLQRVLHSLLAARILLHVREAFQKDTGDTAVTDP